MPGGLKTYTSITANYTVTEPIGDFKNVYDRAEEWEILFDELGLTHSFRRLPLSAVRSESEPDTQLDLLSDGYKFAVWTPILRHGAKHIISFPNKPDKELNIVARVFGSGIFYFKHTIESTVSPRRGQHIFLGESVVKNESLLVTRNKFGRVNKKQIK